MDSSPNLLEMPAPASHSDSPFDDEILKRYLNSPVGTSNSLSPLQLDAAQQPAMHTHPSTADSLAKATPSSVFPTASGSLAPSTTSTQDTLVSAINALGDAGRQQLLAILAMASTGDPKSRKSQSSGSSSGSPASAPRKHRKSLSMTNAPPQETTGISPASVASSGSSGSGAGSGQGGLSSALPVYFANAFQQFIASAPSTASNGNLQAGFARPSSSMKISSSTEHAPNQYTSTRSSMPTPSKSSHPQDASAHRSPAPGTSSSAFYTESVGDETDLLFTPLLSPALTASTQPGPSIGPLPESFASMNAYLGSSHGSSSTKSKSGYNGQDAVAPMHIFSPLTSPALGPTPDALINGTTMKGSATATPVASSSSVARHHRGASKNAPKARPSPIIRPLTSVTESQSEPMQSHHKSASRGNHHHRPTVNTSMPTHSRSGSNAASPQTATFQQSGSAPSSQQYEMFRQPQYSNPPSTTASVAGSAPTSPVYQPMSKLYETSNASLHESPSPQQFDLSSATPATALVGQVAQRAQQSHSQQQEPQPQPHQHYQHSPTQAGNNANAVYNQSAFTGQPQANLQSHGLTSHQMPQYTSQAEQNGMSQKYGTPQAYPPAPAMDLNTMLAMLGMPAYPAMPQQDLQNYVQTQAVLQQLIAEQQRSDNMQIDAEQARMPSNAWSAQSPYGQVGSHEALRRNIGHANSIQAVNDLLRQNTVLAASTNGTSPLTPAAFMGIAPNQYSMLSGLQADQPLPSSPVHPSPLSAQESHHPLQSYASAPQGGSGQLPHGYSGQSAPNGMPSPWVAPVAESAPSSSRYVPEGASRSNLTSATASPALKAIDAQQVGSKSSRSTARKRSTSTAVPALDLDERPTAIAPKRGQKRVSAREANGQDQRMESTAGSADVSPQLAPDARKSSHKLAEQRRRDSLKTCFEDLRFILPPINPEEDEDFNAGNKRPGENNVGGQRSKTGMIDPRHPNKGISKVALLRKSNEYVTKLHERIDRRDATILKLRQEMRTLRASLGQGSLDDVAALDALSTVDWQEYESDTDQQQPPYRIYGMQSDLIGSVFGPKEPPIPEEDDQDEEQRMDDMEEDVDNEDGSGDYKQKKPKRTTSSSSISTRKSAVKG